MKKFLSKVILGLLAFVLTASYAHAQLTFGARAGLNLTNFSEREDGQKLEGVDKSKLKPGFQLGVVAEAALSDNLYIQPGILIATQGGAYKYSETGYSETETINLNYLQIPVNLQYKLDMNGMNLLLQGGPYLGYAFSGKYKVKETEDGKTEKSEEKLDFGTEDGQISQTDFGLGLGVGLQLSDNMQLGLGYNIGLKNLINGGGTSIVMKNNGLALTFTLLFGK